MLSQDEQIIFDYLKPFGRQFVSAKEICRRAGGKRKYAKDPEWAKSLLRRMERKEVLEMDAQGYFRIKPPDDKKRKGGRIPLDPRIAQILRHSGKEFTGSHVLEDDTVYTVNPDKPEGGSSSSKKKK